MFIFLYYYYQSFNDYAGIDIKGCPGQVTTTVGQVFDVVSNPAGPFICHIIVLVKPQLSKHHICQHRIAQLAKRISCKRNSHWLYTQCNINALVSQDSICVEWVCNIPVSMCFRHPSHLLTYFPWESHQTVE